MKEVEENREKEECRWLIMEERERERNREGREGKKNRES